MSAEVIKVIVRTPIVTVSNGQGPAGVAGDYIYIAYASDGTGTGFTNTFNADLDYIAILRSTVKIVSPVVTNFVGLWKMYKGQIGNTGTPLGAVVWQGAWAANHTYAAGDGCTLSGLAYISIQSANLNHSPPNTTWWIQLAASTAELIADWDAGAYQIRALKFESDQVTGIAPFKCVSITVCDNLHAANSDGLEGYAASHFVASGSPEIWRTFPGTPTRVSDSQFTITDTSNANLYDKAFTKGTILRWEKSGGGFQTAIVKDATYGSNTVTINILGNTLAAAFTLMKYCIMKPVKEEFIVPGKLPAAATTDIGKTIFAFRDILIFSALVRYKTAAATTGGVWDINNGGTSIFTTKPPIAAAATKGTDTVCDCVLATAVTVVAADSAITLDYDSGHATTPGSDAYVELLYMPAAWRYLP